MKKIEILRIDSLNRSPLIVEGYLFEGCDPTAPSVAIVGAMEGTTILPLYTASKLVDFLKNSLDDEKKTPRQYLGNSINQPLCSQYQRAFLASG